MYETGNMPIKFPGLVLKPGFLENHLSLRNPGQVCKSPEVIMETRPGGNLQSRLLRGECRTKCVGQTHHVLFSRNMAYQCASRHDQDCPFNQSLSYRYVMRLLVSLRSSPDMRRINTYYQFNDHQIEEDRNGRPQKTHHLDVGTYQNDENGSAHQNDEICLKNDKRGASRNDRVDWDESSAHEENEQTENEAKDGGSEK